jgi:hypothetical protein
MTDTYNKNIPLNSAILVANIIGLKLLTTPAVFIEKIVNKLMYSGREAIIFPLVQIIKTFFLFTHS